MRTAVLMKLLLSVLDKLPAVHNNHHHQVGRHIFGILVTGDDPPGGSERPRAAIAEGLHRAKVVVKLLDVSVQGTSVSAKCLSNFVTNEAIHCHLQGVGSFDCLVPETCVGPRPFTRGSISQLGPEPDGPWLQRSAAVA